MTDLVAVIIAYIADMILRGGIFVVLGIACWVITRRCFAIARMPNARR